MPGKELSAGRSAGSGAFSLHGEADRLPSQQLKRPQVFGSWQSRSPKTKKCRGDSKEQQHKHGAKNVSRLRLVGIERGTWKRQKIEDDAKRAFLNA